MVLLAFTYYTSHQVLYKTVHCSHFIHWTIISNLMCIYLCNTFIPSISQNAYTRKSYYIQGYIFCGRIDKLLFKNDLEWLADHHIEHWFTLYFKAQSHDSITVVLDKHLTPEILKKGYVRDFSHTFEMHRLDWKNVTKHRELQLLRVLVFHSKKSFAHNFM